MFCKLINSFVIVSKGGGGDETFFCTTRVIVANYLQMEYSV